MRAHVGDELFEEHGIDIRDGRSTIDRETGERGT